MEMIGDRGLQGENWLRVQLESNPVFLGDLSAGV